MLKPIIQRNDMISVLRISQRSIKKYKYKYKKRNSPYDSCSKKFPKIGVFFREAGCAAMATSGLCINEEVKRGPLVRIKQKMALKSATRMT